MTVNYIIEKWNKMSLILKVVVGLVVGCVLGIFVPGFSVLSVLGTVFVGAMKSMAPILAFILICSALAKSSNSISSRFKMVIFLFILNTFLASIVSVCGNLIFPVKIMLSGSTQVSQVGGILDVLKNLVTSAVANPVESIAKANYLGILFWAAVFGVCIKKVKNQKVIDVISGLAEAVSKAVSAIIGLAPFGVLGLTYTFITESGISIFRDYGRLLILLVGCMLFCALVIEPLIVFTVLKKNPYPLIFKCFKESGVTAFFTRSSAANIPINIRLCEKLGLDKDFYSVSIPLGATISTNAAAVTISIMTLTLCNTLGVLVDTPTSLLLCIFSTVGACGASGVAGGSLLLIPMTCSLFNISNDVAMQMVGVGFIIGTVQDAVETAVNSSGGVILTATAEYKERIEKQI